MHAAYHTNRNDSPFPIQESDLLRRQEVLDLMARSEIDSSLLGSYEVTLDKKNRLYLPVALRNRYSKGLTIVRSSDGTFFLLDPPQSKQLFSDLNQQASKDPELRDRLIHINSAASVTKGLDTSNRLSIPTEFTRKWQLSSDQKIKLVGNGKCLEIFTEESWDGQLRQRTLWDRALQMPPSDLF